MNITNFISWFIQQFLNIGATMLGKLDQIYIYGQITLMDFMVTIFIVGAFLTIVTTAPRLSIVNKVERSRHDSRK